MPNLYLFDVDRTLTTNTGDKSYAKPIRNLYGVSIDDAQDFSGMTDKLILAKLLVSEGWDEHQIDDNLPALIAELEVTHAQSFDKSSMSILPGVRQLLEALQKRGHVLGLITGNLKAITKLKLEAVDIYSFFTVGAYGDDPHDKRSDLVTLAIARAGFAKKIPNVYSIGDTPLDIEATLGAGAIHAVGVSNGFVGTEILRSSGASIVFEDFCDTDYVLQQLGAG
ncbi:MAG TPA: HAD hydrolase-like protein [Candidatus Saccharimonadales bacterium]|jgi:phosphoglycolate phosphatase-like HAD superfamily hydrolase|nr:HAD hydrolase-like protein [Candidatus Saccharimonadales bacterium]